MPILYRDELNTKDDIFALFYNNNQLFDPITVTYSIYTIIGTSISSDPYNFYEVINVKIVKDQENITALRDSVGYYYADWQVGKQAPIGEYRIIWTFQAFPDSLLATKADEFEIVRDLSEKCEARHIPTGSGDGALSSSGTLVEQCGTCSCQQNQIMRDHLGRIINL